MPPLGLASDLSSQTPSSSGRHQKEPGVLGNLCVREHSPNPSRRCIPGGQFGVDPTDRTGMERICVFPGKQQECLCWLSYQDLSTKPDWKATGIWGAGGRQCRPLGPVAKLPPVDPAVQAAPGALVNEELVPHRAERDISSGFAPFLHPKRDPEHAGGASLLRESPQLPRGQGCGWRSILALWARCWDLAGTGNTLWAWGGGVFSCFNFQES